MKKTLSAYKKHKFQRGFTLIELLIVIAILGIISTIVLNSLNQSRIKAMDSKVKQQLVGFRRAAEIFYSNQSPNSYGTAYSGGSCPTSGAGSMFYDTSAANGNPRAYLATWSGINPVPTLVCGTDGTNYAVKASLPGGNGWCVDSRGTSRSITSAQVTGSVNVCP